MGNEFTEQLASNRSTLIPIDVKKMFASTETSNDISGDWLQLEKATFNDLKKRKKLPKSLSFEALSSPVVYDLVANVYIKDLQKTFKIPSAKETALWSWRPGWYKKYGGDINNIPLNKQGVMGKTARQVMQSRLFNLTKAGY